MMIERLGRVAMVREVVRAARVTGRLRALACVASAAALLGWVGPEAPADPRVAFIPRRTTASPPALASNGAGVLAVWGDTAAVAGVYATRLDASGAPLDGYGARLSGYGWPSVASDGRGYLAVWAVSSTVPVGVYARRLDASGTPAGGAPTVVSDALPQNNTGVGVAWDGSSYLAVWVDSASRSVRARRLGPEGSPLDAAPIVVGTAPSESFGLGRVDVAAGGAGWAVAWEMYATATVSTIYTARVARDGSVLDPGGRAVRVGSARTRTAPALASDGTRFLLTWNDAPTLDPAPPEQHAVLIDPSGAPASATDLMLGTSRPGRRGSAAFDGTRYLVAWPTREALVAARVSAAGAALDASPRSLGAAAQPNEIDDAAVVAVSDGFEVAWTDGVLSNRLVTGVRVRGDGTPAGPAQAIARLGDAQTVPQVASDGDGFVVAWSDLAMSASLEGPTDTLGVRLARVSAAGSVLGVTSPSAAAAAWRSGVAFGGGAYLTLTGARRTDEPVPARGVRLSPSGAELGTPITYATPLRGPVAGPGGFAAFTCGTISLVRLRPDGTELGRTPTLGRVDAARCDAVLSAGRDGYLLAWRDDADMNYPLRFERLGAAGDELDAVPGRLASNVQPGIAAASDGTNHLVVWAEASRSTPGTTALRAARVSPAGAVLDVPALTLAAGSVVAAFGLPAASVAFDGRTYVVAWEDLRTDPAGDLYAARVGTDGALLDPAGVALSATPSPEHTPSLAANDAGTTLVAYSRVEAFSGVQRVEVRAFDLADAGAADAGMSDVADAGFRDAAADVVTADVVTADVVTADVVAMDVVRGDVVAADVVTADAPMDVATVDAPAVDAGVTTMDAPAVDAPSAAPGSDGGGCAVGGGRAPSPSWIVAAWVAALAVRRRRSSAARRF